MPTYTSHIYSELVMKYLSCRMADDDFKVIKVERFDTKGIRHAFDDVGRQTFNNRVSLG